MQSTLLIAAATLLLYSCGKSKDNAKAKSSAKGPMPVEIFVSYASQVNETLEAAGTLLANEQVLLYSELTGRITQLSYDEGSYVRKGTLLVKMFDDDLQAQLIKLRTEERILNDQEKRQSSLLAIQGISQTDYDLALNQLNNNRAEQEIVKAQIRKTEVRAPFDGILGMRNVSQGAMLSQNELIGSIVDASKIKLEFSVPEHYQQAIKKGMKVKFSTKGIADTLDAIVYAVEPSIHAESRNLRARAIFDNDNFKIVPGTFANVYLHLKSRNESIMIPSQGVIPEARSLKVIVIKNNKADIRTVRSGFRDRERVEILEGLNAGDTIVISGLMQIKQGMELRPIPNKQAKANS